ncbi:carboxy-S-adenosyl-L-methionine synthase CmoA [Sulfurimonas sp. HSL-3221]|uniref:carboxy-S-adenosyl-L-methionine synthase CmoA n=1 Tax=Sulfurimonadaceae TaxID=2771471 RepID=UPI001E46583D|nr:carboxy-S-adenosyl-L-methionine synthase CmoA [Sulfurimonas sp. HSL-3221]UFS61490.1 carboxy-S-adenosyl-L-methionine synthase CmoA [Sulfurimonas sp. HSL-3221]
MEDKVFNKPIEKQFEFDEQIAAVFDDMLKRSVPFYEEAMALTKRFALAYLPEGGRLYDLGCSTASTLLSIERELKVGAELVGIDNAASMLEQARRKLAVFGSKIRLEEADIMNFDYEAADVFITNYTLQFIRPPVRETLVQRVYDTLKAGGVFIFSEKVVSEDKRLNKLLIDGYYDFKKAQGYSEYEIMQKREALENVLIPYTEAENREMVTRCGFAHCETIFRWGNFATFIALKK